MENETYERLRDLASKMNPKKINLKLYDNYLHAVKIDCLKTLIEKSRV